MKRELQILIGGALYVCVAFAATYYGGKTGNALLFVGAVWFAAISVGAVGLITKMSMDEEVDIKVCKDPAPKWARIYSGLCIFATAALFASCGFIGFSVGLIVLFSYLALLKVGELAREKGFVK